MNKLNKGFTLVELIVVITILAILGSIAFITMQDFSAEARDSARLTDISQFRSGIEIYNAQSGEFPIPDDVYSSVTLSGGEANYSGYIGKLALSNAQVSEGVVDPLTGEKYLYSTEGNNKTYEVSYTLENPSASLIYTAHASTEDVVVTGNYNGVFAIASDGTKVAIPTLIMADSSDVALGSSAMFKINGSQASVAFTPVELTGADAEALIGEIKTAYNGANTTITEDSRLAKVLAMIETDTSDQATFESGYLKKIGTASGSGASTLTYSCTGSLVTANATISNNTGLTADMPYQNTDSLADCYYECDAGVVGGLCQFNEQKLTASDGAAEDQFGISVSISGDGNTMVVGSYYDDDNGENSGSVYVFTNSGGVWSEQKLIASDGAAVDYFGYSAAVSGDGNTVVVGSPVDDDKGDMSGSVYVFTNSGGVWSEQKLTASDGAAVDQFGMSVSISGDGNTVVVGSRFDDDNGNDSGSVYVFTNSGGVWSEQKLTASDGASSDYFGEKVSISGDGNTVVIGSRFDDDKGDKSGSVYVFTNSGGVRSEQKLTASDGAALDQFGMSVSISGDGNTVVVGSHYDDDNGDDSGSVYVFTNSGGVWSEQKLIASDGASSDYFGEKVSISGDGNTVVVGSRLDDDKGDKSGSVYVFAKSGGTWVEQKLTASDGAASDYFGLSVSVSLDGNTVVVGSYIDDNGDKSGSVYVY